jgi:hypothetical protein
VPYVPEKDPPVDVKPKAGPLKVPLVPKTWGEAVMYRVEAQLVVNKTVTFVALIDEGFKNDPLVTGIPKVDPPVEEIPKDKASKKKNQKK